MKPSDLYNITESVLDVQTMTEELATLTIDPKRFPNPLPKKIGGLFLKKGYRDGDQDDDRVKTASKNISANALKPSQSEIFLGKSLGMAIGGMAGGDLDAIISQDNHILDGHHRWAATMFADPSARVGGVQVQKKIGDLIPVLRSVGDALGNKRRGVPEGGDISIYDATFDDILAAVNTGENMDAKFYNKEKAVAWLEGVGEDVLKERFSKLQSIKPPTGAPPRTDMPVIDADKGQVKLVSDLLVTGKIDIHKPYAKEETQKTVMDVYSDAIDVLANK